MEVRVGEVASESVSPLHEVEGAGMALALRARVQSRTGRPRAFRQLANDPDVGRPPGEALPAGGQAP